jgi:hypothetical protein
MSEDLTFAEYALVLREDYVTFVARSFCDLNPQTKLAMNWHLEVIAGKLTAVREGRIKRLIINLPPRHLKSLMASIAFPAWWSRARPVGPDPLRQLCPGSRRQARPRLPQHHDEPVVPADLCYPPCGAAPSR